jgi:hypothetical protein
MQMMLPVLIVDFFSLSNQCIHNSLLCPSSQAAGAEKIVSISRLF